MLPLPQQFLQIIILFYVILLCYIKFKQLKNTLAPVRKKAEKIIKELTP